MALSRAAPAAAAPPSTERAEGDARAAPRGARGGTALLLVVLPLLAVPFAVLALPAAVFVLLGLLPTLVAYLVDEDDGKYAALTVGPMNVCGLLPPALSAWLSDGSAAQALAGLNQPHNWLIVYGAAAVGWAVHFAVPSLVAAILTARIESTIAGLESEQAELVDEWGPEVGPDPEGDGQPA